VESLHGHQKFPIKSTVGALVLSSESYRNISAQQ